LHSLQERERDVALEMPLVELVEEHRRESAKLRIGEHAPREHAFGHETNARACARRIFEAHGVPDGLADALTELLGDAPRARRAARRRGSSTTISPASVIPASSIARGTRVVFPAPGGASSNERRLRREDAHDLRKHRIDGKRTSIASRATWGLMVSVRVVENVPLASMTTLRLGGPARRLITPDREEEVIARVRDIDAAQGRLLVLGGGSNLVISDAGFDGTSSTWRSAA